MRNFGLIGKTLEHSFSKRFFENYFSVNSIKASYSNLELNEIKEIPGVLKGDYAGLNVTIPYKESIIPYLDELSAEAAEIGAVNVIEFNEDKIIGHNTDAAGFHNSIKPFLTNLHERAIVLGTGGASKAVAYALKNIGVNVIFISRNPEGNNQFSYEEINDHMLKACKLIVNCTPIGTYPNIVETIKFPYEHLSTDHLVVDLIYNPVKTRFLELAEANGATILNGESMLKEQALKAWEIWSNV